MNAEEAMKLLATEFPKVDEDELETYVYGPDDPDTYFATMATDFELFCDFREFIEGRK